MTGIEIIGLIASILQLAGFLHGRVLRICNLFFDCIQLTSRCHKFCKFLTLLQKTLKPYMNLEWEGKSPMGEIVEALKGELKKAQKLVSDSQGKKGLLRWWRAYKFPRKLKESQEEISRYLNLLPLAAGPPTVQVTSAGASTSKARKIARATPATNRRRGLPPKAPSYGSSSSGAQQGSLRTPPTPASASGAPLRTPPVLASKFREKGKAVATNRRRGLPPKAPTSGSSSSSTHQGLLTTPPTPASASGAPLTTPPTPASASGAPLRTPPALAYKGKGKALEGKAHKRIRENK